MQLVISEMHHNIGVRTVQIGYWQSDSTDDFDQDLNFGTDIFKLVSMGTGLEGLEPALATSIFEFSQGFQNTAERLGWMRASKARGLDVSYVDHPELTEGSTISGSLIPSY